MTPATSAIVAYSSPSDETGSQNVTACPSMVMGWSTARARTDGYPTDSSHLATAIARLANVSLRAPHLDPGSGPPKAPQQRRKAVSMSAAVDHAMQAR